jgi:hypothetical protein
MEELDIGAARARGLERRIQKKRAARAPDQKDRKDDTAELSLADRADHEIRLLFRLCEGA